MRRLEQVVNETWFLDQLIRLLKDAGEEDARALIMEAESARCVSTERAFGLDMGVEVHPRFTKDEKAGITARCIQKRFDVLLRRLTELSKG